MAYADLILELEELAQACTEAARHDASEQQLARAYAALRGQAVALNGRNSWLSADECATQIPTLEALRTIESLDVAFGSEVSPSLRADRGTIARLLEALIQLGSWATGIRMAYETLRHMDR